MLSNPTRAMRREESRAKARAHVEAKLLLSPTIPEGVLSSYVSSKTTDKKEFLTATWHPNGGCQLERSQVRHKRVNQRHRERFGACSQLRGLPHASPLRRCSPVGFSGWECNWATL